MVYREQCLKILLGNLSSCLWHKDGVSGPLSTFTDTSLDKQLVHIEMIPMRNYTLRGTMALLVGIIVSVINPILIKIVLSGPNEKVKRLKMIIIQPKPANASRKTIHTF